jgi:tetratricopeptide (TPR) repeat protein
MLREEIEKEVSNESAAEAKVDLLNKFAHEKRNEDQKLSLDLSNRALALAIECGYEKGRAESLRNNGFSKMQSSDHEGAYTALFEALEIYSKLGDQAGVANTQYNIGVTHIRSGNFDSGIEMLHRSLAYRERMNDKAGIASCYFQLTYIYQHFNDLESAYEMGMKSLSMRRELHDKLGQAAALMVLAEVHMKRNELDKAREVLSESMILRKTSTEKMGYFATLLRWAELHAIIKDYARATELSEEGLRIAKDEVVIFGIIRFLQLLGKIAFRQQDMPAAKKRYMDALDYAEKYSFRSMMYEVHQSLSEIYEKEKDFEKAYFHFTRYNNIKEEVITLQSNGRLKSAQLISKIEFAQREAEAEKARNAELHKAYGLVEDKNKEILDSIRYAKRIQMSLLPTDRYIERILNNRKKD